MLFNEYGSLAFRTANQSLSDDQLLANGAMGLAGEAIELVHEITLNNAAEVRKESGDVLWYVALISRIAGVKTLEFPPAPSMMINTNVLLIAVGNTVDHIKKHLYQGHELQVLFLESQLMDILVYISVIAKWNSTTIVEIADGNIDKLVKRFPEGFAAERSINRKIGD